MVAMLALLTSLIVGFLGAAISPRSRRYTGFVWGVLLAGCIWFWIAVVYGIHHFVVTYW